MAKVLVRFTDRDTRKNYQVGDDYTGSADRINHLIGLGYISAEAAKPLPGPVKAKKPKKTK